MSDDRDGWQYGNDGMWFDFSSLEGPISMYTTNDEDEYNAWYEDRWNSLHEEECEENHRGDVREDDYESAQINKIIDDEHRQVRSSLIDFRRECKIKELTKLIACLNNNDQILNKVIKKLFHDNLDNMIIQYSKAERVSFEYIMIAKQQNCLRIIIANYLKNVGNYCLTKDLNDEIDSFIEKISRNDDLETAYQRVHKIQKFIHDKIDQKHGMGKHFYLQVKEIKDLLSTARLHLNIQDFTYKDVNSLSYLIDQSNQQSATEMKNPAKGLLPNGEKYIKSWRAGQMKTALSREVEVKVNETLKLDKMLPTNEYMSLVIEIYARN